MARALDTLSIFDELKRSFSEEQAQALTKVLKEAYEASLEDLVTKGDLKELGLRIENKFESFRGELTSLRGELTLLKWMMGFIFAGVLSLVLKAFFSS